MFYVLVVCGALVALIVAVVLVGALLPADHFAARAATLRSPAEPLFQAMLDIEQFHAWRPDVEKVERLPDRDGRLVWRETGGHGPATLERVEAEPPRRLVTRMSRFVFGHTATLDAYLAALAKKAGEQVTPGPA